MNDIFFNICLAICLAITVWIYSCISWSALKQEKELCNKKYYIDHILYGNLYCKK